MKRLFWLLPLLGLSFLASSAEVKLYEKEEMIPTYLAGPPDPNPMFYFGRESQGARGRIYPYPLYDNLTNRRGEKSYHLVYLENEFVKIAIAPEIGGRLISALDKTDNYDFIYHQHVIKPALIGLIGAWISGGIEWNIPHHHRATTFLPVQWRTEKNADGSKTVWVGEMEIRDRMSWAVGYTLHPHSSVLTCSVRILNRTPIAHSMLCFANAAVSANENYQIIFPPGTQWVTFHGKREFASWPIAHSRYAGADFTAGVDVSWWKNHIMANSMFAWNYTDDFFGGYDHGRQAGIVAVADHHVVPGKKFWTWGSGPRGRLWDDILTDVDGPYIELMSGAYSDNQPDYSWLQPFETRAFEMNWYPVRGINGFKNANLEAAGNLEITNRTAKFGFCTTAAYRGASARLSVAGKELVSEKVTIAPNSPYTRQVELPEGFAENELRISLSDGARELISYSPVKPAPQSQPEVVTPIPAPQDFQNQEELFLAGQRVEQFQDPRHDGEDYWNEVLRRDPGDIAANTSLGVFELQRARFEAAQQHLRKALERLTARYTTPKDAEPMYYLGLALKAQGKTDEAFETLYKAAWSQQWKGPAYFELAEIASARGNFSEALNLIDHSLEANALNVRASVLKAAMLRHLGRAGEARDCVLMAQHHTNPLDPGLLAEQWLLGGNSCAQELFTTLNSFPTTAQEVAAEFLDSGLWDDGRKVLEQSVAAAPDKSKISPLVYYYLGEFAEKLGDSAKAAEFRGTAAQQPFEYVFPFQSEMLPVLEHARQANPQDARAPYYLGTLLFDWQPAEAVALWEKSAALDSKFPMVWRNLAQAYAHQDTEEARLKAAAFLEKAVALKDDYPTHFAELDRLYHLTGAPVEKRLALLEQHRATVIRKDESLAALISLKTFTENADEAVSLLRSRTFSLWEGGTAFSTGDAWADAHLVLGLKHIRAKEFHSAIEDFQAGLKPPGNLRAEQRGPSRQAEFSYWSGLAQASLGNKQLAAELWQQAATSDASRREGNGNRRENSLARSSERYFQALARQKLAITNDVKEIFHQLVSSGESAIKSANDPSEPAGGASSRERCAAGHYAAGLGYAGLGEKENAGKEFRATLELLPDQLGAKLALEMGAAN